MYFVYCEKVAASSRMQSVILRIPPSLQASHKYFDDFHVSSKTRLALFQYIFFYKISHKVKQKNLQLYKSCYNNIFQRSFTSYYKQQLLEG